VTVSDRYAIPLDEARRGLDQQQSDLNSLRDRAGNLLQFGALAAGFIGALVLRGDDAAITGWTIAGAVCFAAMSLLLVYVLWPRLFTFSNDARTLLKPEWDRSDDDFAKYLATYLEDNSDENRTRIGRMTWAYTGALVALVGDIGCLLIDLLGR
jgi:hypothetical protein